jgi:formiminotetrahydrofolate cyclodeaminase
LKGNPNALSDIGVDGFLADTAFRGGLLNIEINLKSIKDRAFVQEMKFLIKRLKRERNEIRKKWKGTI